MSNRNFDASVVTKRLRDKNVAQQIYGTIQNGRAVGNPQTANFDVSLMEQYEEGVETTTEFSLKSTYSFDPGAIANYVALGEAGGGGGGPAPTVPSPPTGLSATPSNGEITVSFTPGDNGGSVILNYEYSTDNGTSYTAFSPATGAVSSVTITGLTNGTAYTIRLKAVNAVGVSTASASVTATPANSPSSPTGLSGVGGNETIYILFTAGANGGSPITNYQYSIDNGSTFTAFSPPQTSNPLIINGIGLTNGTPYDVQLKAVNAVGTSSASATSTITPTVNTLRSSNRLIYLDANNSASYDGSGTTWTNLDSGGSYSATLIDGPDFDTYTPTNKFFTFDGISQVASIAAAAAINPTTPFGSITVQVWADVNTGSPNFTTGDGLISKQFGVGGGYDGYSLGLRTNTSLFLGMNGGTVNGVYSSSTGAFSGGWALYTIVVRFGGGAGSPSYTYVSTQRVVTANNGETGMPFANAPLQFPRGIQETGSNFCPANIAAIYYYNTALSQEDIIRNYDATRSRFGL